MFFDRQVGLQEPLLRIPGDRHKRDALVHVAKVGIKPQFELSCDFALLLSKLRSERIEDRVLDLLVQIIEIDLLHSIAEPCALRLKSPDGLVMVAFDVRKILAKRLGDPAEHGIGHRDAIEPGHELLEQHFLADIRLAALLLGVAAPVVDVLLLLDVADKQAAAMAALDHSGEQEIPLDAADARRMPAVQHALDPLPELNRYQRLM